MSSGDRGPLLTGEGMIVQTQSARGDGDQLTRGIEETRNRLVSEFHERIEAEVIQKLVDETFAALRDSTVREFVPLFVYRTAREQLADMARAEAVLADAS